VLVFASGCDRGERPPPAPASATATPSVVRSAAVAPSAVVPSLRIAPSATPLPSASTVVTVLPSGRRHRVRYMFVTDASGETTCSITDLGDTFRGGLLIADREAYSFPKINAKLRKYPEFAAAIGITEVKDCNDARRYMERYHAYEELHPDFDFEGPTKEEQFRKFLSDPNNVARPRDLSR
jgi:hypothetical protein